MTPWRIISAAITGTTFMTIYSVLLSELKNKNFREPDLLANMIDKSLPLNKNQAKIHAWLLHYMVGFLFALVYLQWLKHLTTTKPSLKQQIAVGAITGLAGIAGWEVLLSKHSSPPRLKKRSFYGQLFIAHIIFAVATLQVLTSYRRKTNSIEV